MPVSQPLTILEQRLQTQIGKDQTQIATLTKEMPHIPLSEATCNFGSIALVFGGVVAAVRIKRQHARRAAAKAAASAAGQTSAEE